MCSEQENNIFAIMKEYLQKNTFTSRPCNYKGNVQYIHMTFDLEECRIINLLDISIMMKATRYQIDLRW